MLRQLGKFVCTGSSTRYILSSVSKVLGGQENFNRHFSNTTNKLTIRRNGLVPEIGIQSEKRRLSFIKKIICPSPKPKKTTKDDEFCCISKQEYCRLKKLDKQKAKTEKEKGVCEKMPIEKTTQSDNTLKDDCKKKMESVSNKAKKLLSIKKKKEGAKCISKKKQPKKDPCPTKKVSGKDKQSSDPCKNPFNQKESDINAFKDKQMNKNAEDKNNCIPKKEKPIKLKEKSESKKDECSTKKEKKEADPCKEEKIESIIDKCGDRKEVKAKKKPSKEKIIDCKPKEKLDEKKTSCKPQKNVCKPDEKLDKKKTSSKEKKIDCKPKEKKISKKEKKNDCKPTEKLDEKETTSKEKKNVCKSDEKKIKSKEKKNDCKSDEKLYSLIKPTESKTCDKATENNTDESCVTCSEEHCLEDKPSNVIMPKKENDNCKQLNMALVPVPESQLKKDVCGKKKSAFVGIIQKGKEWACNKNSNKQQDKNVKLMKQVEKEEKLLNEEKHALMQKKKRMTEERQLVEVEKNLCDEETSQFEKEKTTFTSEKKMLNDLKQCIEHCEAEEKNKNDKC